MRKFFYEDETGNSQGPFNGREFAGLIADGTITETTKCHKDSGLPLPALELVGQSKWLELTGSTASSQIEPEPESRPNPPALQAAQSQPSQDDVPAMFLSEIDTWIKAIDKLFGMVILALAALVVLGGVAAIGSGNGEAGIITLLGGAITVGVLIVLQRFQMIFLRYMRATIHTLISIRDRR